MAVAKDFIGRWTGNVDGLTEKWVIEQTGGVWSITGRYFEKDKQVGSFFASDPSFRDGTLTFTQRFGKKPRPTYINDISFRVNVDGTRLKYRFMGFDMAGSGTLVPDSDSKPPDTGAIAENKQGLIKDSPPLSDTISACVFSTDGKKIYAATRQGIVHVLDAASLNEIAKLNVAKTPITHMVLKPKVALSSGPKSPERLYVLDTDKHILVWDPEKRGASRNWSTTS